MTQATLIPSAIHGLAPLDHLKPARPAADPRRELRLGGAVIGAFLAIGVGWACFTPLDAAVSAAGTVKVSGERQKVQAFHEGVISGLDVREGQLVRKGDVLVEFATVDALSSERALASQVIGLQAQIARLQALESGTAFAPPAAFATYTGDDKVLADRAMALETATLAAQRRAHAAENAVLRQRSSEIAAQIAGTATRHDASERQRTLMAEEVQSIGTLAAKGFASKNRLIELQREAADLDGSIGTTQAEAARLRASVGENTLQIAQGDSQLLQQTTDRLREAQSQLQSVLPQWTAARDQLARTQVRAPVTGTIVGLAVHTVGGVAGAGQTLMEIVPRDEGLTIEAKVAPNDINQLHAGQPARLHVAALKGRGVPVLQGTVSRVSADSFTDEKSGQSYYLMNVSVPASELARLRAAEGDAGRLRPGNPMQVQVTLRPRSALSYWLEPITEAFRGSLHEQ